MALLAAGQPSCGAPRPPAQAREPTFVTARIVVTERGRRGGHLVLIGEDGRRLADLTRGDGVALRDNSPAWSPDGRWIAFASTRGRDLTRTSLWIIAARSDARAHKMTRGDWVDRDPVWSPDGQAIVFVSNRAGSFDIWRAAVALGKRGYPEIAGDPVQVTSAPTHEFHPSVSPDGSLVTYSAASDETGSSLWTAPMAGGAANQLTRGPADLTPAWSPDGTRIAFAAPAPGRSDTDLYVIGPDGGNRQHLLDEPRGDQAGPRWSQDSRYLFCTSIYRAATTGRAMFGSVTVIDLRENPPVLRALQDPAVPETRTSPAIAPAVLLSTALHENELYADALRDVVLRELRDEIEQEKARRRTSPPGPATSETP